MAQTKTRLQCSAQNYKEQLQVDATKTARSVTDRSLLPVRAHGMTYVKFCHSDPGLSLKTVTKHLSICSLYRKAAAHL